MKFTNIILVITLSLDQSIPISINAFSPPIPKYQRATATRGVSSGGGSIIRGNYRGDARSISISKVLLNNDGVGEHSNDNGDHKSIEKSGKIAASIILGLVSASQLGVGVALAAIDTGNIHIGDVSLHHPADSSIAVVDKQLQSAVTPYMEAKPSYDSSINHFLLLADGDTATIEKTKEEESATIKAEESKKAEEEAADKKKAEEEQKVIEAKLEKERAEKKALEAKLEKERAEKKANEEQVKREKEEVDKLRAKEEAEKKAQESEMIEKAESIVNNAKVQDEKEEQQLLKDGDELIKDKMDRLAVQQAKQDKEAAVLREKQEKIERLSAEQKARATTINKLKSVSKHKQYCTQSTQKNISLSYRDKTST